MRTLALGVCAAGLFGLAAGAASAADLPTHKTPVAPVVAPEPPMQFYVRGQVGGAWFAGGHGDWTGPGPGDPSVTESLSTPASFTGGGAIGVQLMPGIRTDLSFDYLGQFNVNGTPIAPNGGVGHASMTSTTTTGLVMGNLYVEPFRLMNINTGFVQPFLTGGVGMSINDFGDWSRINPAAPGGGPVVRTFSGASPTNLAWTAGAGLTFDVSSLFHRALYLDLTYRYVDAGRVTGGSTPISDRGNSPRQPFNYEMTANVGTVGLRLPF
jgi:opacity protein-like surface antigen